MLSELSFLILFIIPFVSVLVVTPKLIKRMYLQGFLGRDMNKYSKPKVAELGGVSVFLGFSFGFEDWTKYGAMFGFGDKTGIDLPGERSGLLPSTEHYSFAASRNS